jgi:hypothetical protein
LPFQNPKHKKKQKNKKKQKTKKKTKPLNPITNLLKKCWEILGFKNYF